MKTGYEEKIYYTMHQFKTDVDILASKIVSSGKEYDAIYGIPQGGTVLAQALSDKLNIPMIDLNIIRGVPERNKILVVDDVVDSGTTMKNWGYIDFASLHVKKGADLCPEFYVLRECQNWIVYWWEGSEKKSIEDSVVRQLQYVGEDPTREGLIDTPKRVSRALREVCRGYTQKVEDLLKVFTEGACDEMVVLKDIEMYSLCEHHLMPFFGKVHVAYIPNGKVIGISKLARLVDMFSRRLQIQERIGEQVTTALMEHLQPLGAACIIEAQHFCMMSRGIQKQHSKMMTSSLKGAFLDKPEARAELMRLVS